MGQNIVYNLDCTEWSIIAKRHGGEESGYLALVAIHFRIILIVRLCIRVQHRARAIGLPGDSDGWQFLADYNLDLIQAPFSCERSPSIPRQNIAIVVPCGPVGKCRASQNNSFDDAAGLGLESSLQLTLSVQP